MKYVVYLEGPNGVIEFTVEGEAGSLLSVDANSGFAQIGDTRVDKSKVLAVVPADQMSGRLYLAPKAK